MPFKIVSTIERGRSVLTTVPASWESDGCLFWPRLTSMKVDKLRRLESSEPEDDWKIVNCILKRNKLTTFENAEVELEKMCSNSDTDNEKESKTVKKKTQPPLTFDTILQECLNSTDADSLVRGESSNTLKQDQMFIVPQNQTKTASVSRKPQVEDVITIPQEPRVASLNEGCQEFRIENIQINDGLLIDKTLATKIDYLISKVNTIQENQDVLQANINVVIENQKVCYETQQLMMFNFSQTVTQLEEFMNKSSQLKKKKENDCFLLIQDHEQLRRLEHLLENSEKELEIKKQLSTICGKGKGRGINNAYALIDAMFDRTFLLTCSWAGGSRSTETKVCFKSFTKVIKLFFDIVYDSDNCFTLNECHTFFKNVLKNSSQRCKSQNVRKSTTKNRPKKKVNDNTNKILSEGLSEKDKLSEKTITESEKSIERTLSEVKENNKITPPQGEREPQSNIRLPLKEFQNINTISVDAEVYV